MTSQLKLWCLITDDPNPFSVSIFPDEDVAGLKDAIQNEVKNGALRGIHASALVLWKLKDPELVKPEDSLPTRIQSKGRGVLSQFAVKLGDCTASLSEVFISTPRDDYLYILVCPPSADRLLLSSFGYRRGVADPPRVSGQWTDREKLLGVIYAKLCKYKLIQVRGTPGSGKTTLCSLLHRYILQVNPEARVYVKSSWPTKSDQDNRSPAEKFGITREDRRSAQFRKIFILFDEAQSSYWDIALWNDLLKNIEMYPYHIILFCSYGSAGRSPVEYTGFSNPIIRPQERVSLRWDTLDALDAFGPAGLLLSEEEYAQLLRKRVSLDFTLSVEMRNAVYDWTGGHVGAIVDLLYFIESKKNYALRAGEFTLEDFDRLFPPSTLITKLANSWNFSQGIALDHELQQVEIAATIKQLLVDGSIGSIKERPAQDSALDTCFRNGWVHSERSFKDGWDYNLYAFPSPLHAMYYSGKFSQADADVELPYQTVSDLAIACLRRFKPSRLSGAVGRVGAGFIDRPPEVQYQDEFYRALHDLTKGGVLISPEFAAASKARPGRVDFFIGAKKWGIEVLRDGNINDLQEHGSTRFEPGGAYQPWIISTDVTAYIILDFGTNRPTKRHPSSKFMNLVHVVLSDSFTTVTVLSNVLEELDSFSLLENH